MLLASILVGASMGGFFGFQAAYIGATEDHRPSSPRWCGRAVTQCPASRFVVTLITLICAVQGGLVAGILVAALL